MSVPTKRRGSPLPESKKEDEDCLQKPKRSRQEENLMVSLENEEEEQQASDDAHDGDHKVCVCGCKRMFFVGSKACDGNYYQIPGGVEREGYMCTIPNITNSDGVFLHFCVECGRIYGFNRDAVQKVIEEIENEDDHSSEGDEDDDAGDGEDENEKYDY